MKKIRIGVVLALCAVLLALAACSPSISSLRKKFEKEGYTVQVATREEAEASAFDGAKKALLASKMTDNGLITITCIWFKSEADAADAESKEKMFGESSGKKTVRKGKMVACGDEEAIELL